MLNRIFWVEKNSDGLVWGNVSIEKQMYITSGRNVAAAKKWARDLIRADFPNRTIHLNTKWRKTNVQ